MYEGTIRMKRTLLATAAAVLVLGAPAFAADSMMKASPTDATMMCRPAMKGEKPEAMIGTKGIVCKPMDKMMAPGHMGPNTKAMDKAATDKAWQDWLDQAIVIPSAAAG
jgi:hypothetical protein